MQKRERNNQRGLSKTRKRCGQMPPSESAAAVAEAEAAAAGDLCQVGDAGDGTGCRSVLNRPPGDDPIAIEIADGIGPEPSFLLG